MCSNSSATSASNLKGNPALLIKEVHARRPIWDLKSPAHHNRDIVQKLWTEISQKLGKPMETIKNKWKHLRDNFRTELKKTVRGTGNPPQPYQSQWTFFSDLLFLEEQMMKKINRTYGPFPYKAVFNSENYDEYNCEDGFSNENDNENGNRNYFTQTHSVFDDNSLNDQEPLSWWLQNDLVNASNGLVNNNTEHIRIKKRRVNQDDNITDSKISHQFDTGTISDDDYHFMMSLLPYVKSLPVPRKMFLRLKLQELVCNFIYKLDPSSSSSDLNCSNNNNNNNSSSSKETEISKNNTNSVFEKKECD